MFEFNANFHVFESILLLILKKETRVIHVAAMRRKGSNPDIHKNSKIGYINK
jgi:hypothetical protein